VSHQADSLTRFEGGHADPAPLFGGSELAARIERAEAELMAEATRAAVPRHGREDAGFVTPVAGALRPSPRRAPRTTRFRAWASRACRTRRR
jgi:hypothetical protein